jgi:ubiquinone/menaquinone biosynthesis C-methylase UbiE
MLVPISHRLWLTRNKIINHIEKAAAHYAGGKLLDVGCGSKPYQALFRSRVDEYLGLDVPYEYRPAGRHSMEDGQDGRDIDVYGSALALPVADAAFDTVVSFQVLEHVPEPQMMFAEMSRVLKPGGYLILMAPQMWHLHEVPRDYFRYTRYGLAYLAEKSGMDVVEITPLAGFWARVGLKISYTIDHMSNMMEAKVPFFHYVLRLNIIPANIVFRLLDRWFPDYQDCINNLMVSCKTAGNSSLDSTDRKCN